MFAIQDHDRTSSAKDLHQRIRHLSRKAFLYLWPFGEEINKASDLR
jgi:hypothetical protein